MEKENQNNRFVIILIPVLISALSFVIYVSYMIYIIYNDFINPGAVEYALIIGAALILPILAILLSAAIVQFLGKIFAIAKARGHSAWFYFMLAVAIFILTSVSGGFSFASVFEKKILPVVFISLSCGVFFSIMYFSIIKFYLRKKI